MKFFKKINVWFSLMLLLSIVIASCSTEKNTFINRSYHGLTAKYNGYFNATELIRLSLEDFQNNKEENFYEILPVELLPDVDEVLGMYPAIDTAISKCTKVIRKHSMPNNDRPHKKKDEHNPYIDENWTEIGIASYYRRDYEGALKAFEYVRKFYNNDPSLYVGQLWMAKTYVATGDLTNAKLSLDYLDKVIAEEAERKENKQKKSRSKISKKKKKEDEIADFPKKIMFDFERTKAALALEKKEYDKAITHLEAALKHAKKSKDKARIHFILGQLYEREGNNKEAASHYKQVLKKNAPYPMQFNARLKKSFLGNDDDAKKALMKMLKDAKNAPFKDQIYYALANFEFRENNEEKGVEYLHLCAFYSSSNTRQKGMAYEKLGDLSFSKRKYVSAQKYYDSCASVITETYPNGEIIKNKADNLAALVVAVETVTHEDSVQRIASMSDGEQQKFIADYIKEVKRKEAERKEREALRLRELQENENLFADDQSNSKWYWGNAKAKAEGVDEFKKQWGQREDTDDWRRSQRIISANDQGADEQEEVDSIIQPDDTLTVEYLMQKLPLADSSLALSTKRLLEARYNAGVIYKEQLSEPGFAKENFQAVLDKKSDDPHDLLSAFQLYKMAEGVDDAEASKQRNYILSKYPKSDFANYLKDPNYFIKKKERDALAEKAYVKVLNRYSQGLYYPVLSKANRVISNEKDNIYRAKYMLLKAMAKGQLTENKKDLIPILEQLITEYPDTDEAVKGKEMLDIIKNGYSENIEADFSSKYPFEYSDREPLYIIIFLEKGQSSANSKSRIVDFQREYFSRDKLKTTSKIYGSDQSVILINEFETEADAKEYIRIYKKTRKYLLDLQHAEIYMITKSNLRVVFEQQSIDTYKLFYDEYY